MEDAVKSEARRQGPLSVRFRRLRLPLLGGFFAIVYAALLLVYVQQQQTQKGLSDEIALKEQQLLRPVAMIEKFTSDYQTVQRSIPRGLLGEDVISAVVGVAEKYGFDVTIGKTRVSVAQKPVAKEKVGATEYQVQSFTISGVEGDYERVKQFISALYSEMGLETLVLKKVTIAQEERSTSATIELSVYSRP